MARHLLSLHDVSLAFGGDPVLDGVSLNISSGMRACVTGRNGEGKSTLLKVIAGLEDAQEGSVSIDGEPMEGIAPEKRPVAMVFQKALLFHAVISHQSSATTIL